MPAASPPPPAPASPQLQAYAATYRRAQLRAHDITDGLSDDAFNWKPAADAWSVGECLVHLNIIAEGYAPVFEAALRDGAPRGEGPFRYGWLSRRFIGALRPGSRPIPTAASMKPPPAAPGRSSLDRDETLAAFDRLTERLVALTERAEGFDLARITVRSPFMRLLRLPLGAFLDALGQHALRHTDQAERVTERAGFPG